MVSEEFGISDTPVSRSTSQGPVSNRIPLGTVNLTPNTGYQITFLPLFAGSALDKIVKELPGVPKIPGEAKQAVRKLVEYGPWRNASSYSWIKAKIEKRSVLYKGQGGAQQHEDIYGIVVAIETNIGNFKRGYAVKESKINLNLREVPDASIETEFPFVAEEIGVLHAQDCIIDIAKECNFNQDIEGWKDPACLKINWIAEAGDAIKVDLIVDFGNSRTNVMMLENISIAKGNLAGVCQPLAFRIHDGVQEIAEIESQDLDQILPESWFLMKEPLFQSGKKLNDPYCHYVIKSQKTLFGTKKIVSSQHDIILDKFKSISPAVMGPVARELLKRPTADERGLSRLSSPKRYTWAKDPTATDGETFWAMRLNSWHDEDELNLTPLAGEVLRFISRDLKVWDSECPPYKLPPDQAPVIDPPKPNHPKAVGMVFSALTLIETAYQQLNSEAWRSRGIAAMALRREIENVVLTCPPGWTAEEAKSFFDAWVLAARTFWGSRVVKEPAVKFALDEALAAQLPFVYAEIEHLGSNGRRFTELFGRNDESGNMKVRVMTVDIGGGTTDTSITDYDDRGRGRSKDLFFQPIFKDSNTAAGDMLVKRLIEEVLIPATIPDAASLEVRARAKKFYSMGKSTYRADLVARLVFIPMILSWIRDLVENVVRSKQELSFDKVGASRDVIEQLNEALSDYGLSEITIKADQAIEVSYKKIKDVVQSWLEPIVDAHARFAAVFDIDLLILTGKPSEIPLVKELMAKAVPIHEYRIISAKGYYLGEWAPFTDHGFLRDAKLVTALGASLFQAIRRQHIANWVISIDDVTPDPQRNYWGIMDGNTPHFNDDDVILSRDEDEAEHLCSARAHIGRALFLRHSKPEQVYTIRWKGPGASVPNRFKVRLRRNNPYPTNQAAAYEFAEELKLVEAKIWDVKKQEWVSSEHVELQLCTLPDGEDYWLDTGIFEAHL